MQAWWSANFSRKKTLAYVFSCKFSEIFKKTYFAEHSRRDAWLKWTKIEFTKSIHRKTPVMASFLVQLQTCGLSFSKRDSITDVFLWTLGSFTEHQLYRSMLGDCFWFPVTFSMDYLPYQCYISSVIAWKFNISITSVIIIALYYISIILVSILVLYYYYISINIVSLVLSP